MPKIHLTTKTGTKIVIEGTPGEVAELVSKIEGGSTPAKARRSTPQQPQGKSRPTPMTLLSDLADGGFFKKPRELSAIKSALEEQGHHYPVTSLSPTVLRLVRKRLLRRIKDGQRWQYVQ
jgi:hypothetical protein